MRIETRWHASDKEAKVFACVVSPERVALLIAPKDQGDGKTELWVHMDLGLASSVRDQLTQTIAQAEAEARADDTATARKLMGGA